MFYKSHPFNKNEERKEGWVTHISLRHKPEKQSNFKQFLDIKKVKKRGKAYLHAYNDKCTTLKNKTN